MNYTKVNGKNKKHHVILFALSTCGWCRKTKELLKSLEVEFNYVDVDTLSDNDLVTVRQEVKKHNPHVSFPTIVIDNGKEVIIGYQDEKIREVLT